MKHSRDSSFTAGVRSGEPSDKERTRAATQKSSEWSLTRSIDRYVSRFRRRCTAFGGEPDDNRFILHVRTANRPESIINPVREALRSIDSQVPIVEIHTLAEEVSASLSSERLVATLATVFGALAALLTAVGLYGLLAYAVAQRRREIGIRMALGARASDISGTIGGQAFVMITGGLAAGIGATLLAAPAIRSLLYGISPSDWLTLLLTMVFVLSVGVIATVIPVLRALRVDPATALRQD